MVGILAALLIGVTPADVDAAFADLKTLPVQQHYTTAYLSLSDAETLGDKEKLEAVAKVVACSLSYKSHLPSQNPYRVPDTNLLRLDLEALGWQSTYAKVILAHYPYRPDVTKYGKYPLVISALIE